MMTRKQSYLTLHSRNSPSEQAIYTRVNISLLQINQEWDEMDATSMNRLSGVPWSQEYMDESGPDAGPQLLTVEPYHPKRPQGYMAFNVKKAVKNWQNGSPNYGLLVIAEKENNPGLALRFRSREHAEPMGPFLDVLCD